MIPKVTQETIDLGDGRAITIETGKLAKQADGSVVVRCGDCMLLATAVSARTSNPGVDFLPLTVDYRDLQLQEDFLEDFSKEKRVQVTAKY